MSITDCISCIISYLAYGRYLTHVYGYVKCTMCLAEKYLAETFESNTYLIKVNLKNHFLICFMVKVIQYMYGKANMKKY